MKKITEVIVERNIYSAYLKRSKRSKTALKVTDDLEIIISSPKNLSENEFKKILKNASLWIESEVIKKKKLYDERKVKEFQDGRVIWLNGKCYDLIPN
ncbi:MAG TPA: M48 family metallopeptidase, partial [Acholeplasmataceae bacterium]|nr:M48 family metallopeptidase [Acholeplasmataceae bacterium]